MNKRISLVGLMALGAFLPGLASAGPGGGVQYDTARVLNVDPVVRYVTVKTPYQECWDEEQYTDRSPRRASPGGSALAGGLIGGVIGNQFGDGDGNIYATVAGALIGSSIGRSKAEQQNAASRYSEREVYTVQRCSTKYNYEQQERIDGYDVRYEYRGQTYTTRMSQAPAGDRIKVRVAVTPVSSY